jgi:hypothetical protein
MVNYGTKPRVNSSWGNTGQEPSSSSELPPYIGNGKSFYGVDEKTALKNAQADEGNVSAWQVIPLYDNLITLQDLQIIAVLCSYFYSDGNVGPSRD